MSDAPHYVTLGIDQDVFAVPVAMVQEILDMRDMARLPHAPPYLLGIIDVRGQSVPVIDLRVEFGRPRTPVTENTRILVLEAKRDGRSLVLGLMTDRVFEVTALDSDEMEAPPEIGGRWRSEHITGIGRRNGAFVIVFDPARLFSAADLAGSGGVLSTADA